MNYQKANSVSNTLLITAMVFLGGSILIQNWLAQLVCLLVGAGCIIAAIVMRIMYWRCPHCKKMLPLGFRMEPERCPKCKELLLHKEEK